MPTPRETLNSDLEAAKFRFEKREAEYLSHPMPSFHGPAPSELLHAEERAAYQKYYDGLQQLWVGNDPTSTIGQLAAEKITRGSHRPAPLSEGVELDLEYGGRSLAAELLQKVGVFFERGAENFSSPRALRAAVRAVAEHGAEIAVGESTPREWKSDFGMTPGQALALLDGHIRGNADPVFNQILAGHELSAKPAVMPVPPTEGSVANDPQKLVALFPNGKLTRGEARTFAARQQVIDAGTHSPDEIAAMVNQVDAMQRGQLEAALEKSVEAAQGQMAQALKAIANGALGRETVNQRATTSHHSHSAAGSGNFNRNSSSQEKRTFHGHGQKKSGELGFGAQEQRQIAGSADQVLLQPVTGPFGALPGMAVVPAQTAIRPAGELGLMQQQFSGQAVKSLSGQLAASDWSEDKQDAAQQDLQADGKFDFQVGSSSFNHVERYDQHAEWNIPPDTGVTLETLSIAATQGQYIESSRAAAGKGGQAEVGHDFARASGGDGPVTASYAKVEGGVVTAKVSSAMTFFRGK